jgi:hypothetical protein
MCCHGARLGQGEERETEEEDESRPSKLLRRGRELVSASVVVNPLGVSVETCGIFFLFFGCGIEE